MGRKPGIEPGPGVPQTPVLAGTPLSPIIPSGFFLLLYMFCVNQGIRGQTKDL